MTRRFEIAAEGLPDLPGMMLVTIEALKKIGGSATVRELDEEVIELEGLSEAEQAFQMSNDDGRPRANYYLAWARTYLRRGGAIENSSRGVWTLTDKGAGLTTIIEAKAIYDQVNREERERTRQRRLQQRPHVEIAQPQAMPSQAAVAVAPIENQPDGEESWRVRLLAVLGEMHPAAFERLAQRLLREAGFTKVEVRGKSGDGGIDGVGVLRVNLVSFQVYFQCKRWRGSVGAGEIRDFRGAMQGRADKGLFITTGRFTAQSSDEATRDGAIAIDLIDGERLCDLLKENRLGVKTQLIEQIDIDADWFAQF